MKHSSEDISAIFKYPRRRKTAHVMNWKLLALLCCSLFSCQATPIRREVTSKTIQDKEVTLEKEVNCALHVLISAFTVKTYNTPFPLGYKVLCKMHDQYTYITNNLEFQSPIGDCETSNLLLQSLRSTCQWVLLKDNTMLSRCSLPEIRQACAAYRLHEHQSLTRELLDEFNRNVTKDLETPNNLISRFVKTEPAREHLCKNSTVVKAACTC